MVLKAARENRSLRHKDSTQQDFRLSTEAAWPGVGGEGGNGLRMSEETSSQCRSLRWVMPSMKMKRKYGNFFE